MNKALIAAILALFCVLGSAAPGMMRPRIPLPIEKFQDHNLGALNVGVNAGNNGFGANAGYQGNIGRNGQWNVGGQIQTQPGGRPNWGVNAGMTIKFDDEGNELFVLEDVQDNDLGALNLGVNAGNNGFGANAGYQGNIGRNGQWNVGGQIQTQPGGRPNWGVNAGLTMKFDEEDDELFALEDVQDNDLGALNVGVNAGNNGFGANAGYQGNIGRNGQWNVGGQIQTQPGGRPNWGVNAGMTIKFDDEGNELFVLEDVQDNDLGALNVGVNAGNNGFGANAGYQGNIGRNGNWNVGGQIQTQPGGRPNWGVNAGMTIKFDEEAQDELFALEDVQDNDLGALNVGVNAGNNGFGANAGYQGQLRNGQWNVGGQIQTNPGGRPNWGVNAGLTMKFDEEQ